MRMDRSIAAGSVMVAVLGVYCVSLHGRGRRKPVSNAERMWIPHSPKDIHVEGNKEPVIPKINDGPALHQ